MTITKEVVQHNNTKMLLTIYLRTHKNKKEKSKLKKLLKKLTI